MDKAKISLCFGAIEQIKEELEIDLLSDTQNENEFRDAKKLQRIAAIGIHWGSRKKMSMEEAEQEASFMEMDDITNAIQKAG